jgi:hypothetical protein
MHPKQVTVGAFPRMYQRPDYGPALPVLSTALLRNAQLPLMYTAACFLLSPAYAALLGGTRASAATATILSTVSPFAPWVTADDVFFTVGLSFAVGASYVLGNGFFFLLDSQGFLQEYKLPRTRAQEPSAGLVRKTLVKEATAHGFTGPVIMLFLAGPGLRAVGSPVDASLLPRWPVVWAQLALQLVVNETMFYFGAFVNSGCAGVHLYM